MYDYVIQGQGFCYHVFTPAFWSFWFMFHILYVANMFSCEKELDLMIS
jgi:hypothetical protein